MISLGPPPTSRVRRPARRLAAARLETSQSNITGTGEVDITSLSVTFTARRRAFKVRLFIPQVKQNANAAYNVFAKITDGSNVLQAQSTKFLLASATLANNRISMVVEAEFDASPGTSYTFKGRILSSSASADYTIDITSAGARQAATLVVDEIEQAV